jgi:hypothetical protein
VPGTRAELDDVVRRGDSGAVVLDHQDRSAQPRQLLEQAAHLARIEPDRRLVQHVDDVLDTVRQQDGKSKPLRLAARERGRRAVEPEIVEPDALQRLQPSRRLANGAGGAGHELETFQQRPYLGDRPREQLLERQPVEAIRVRLGVTDPEVGGAKRRHTAAALRTHRRDGKRMGASVRPQLHNRCAKRVGRCQGAANCRGASSRLERGRAHADVVRLPRRERAAAPGAPVDLDRIAAEPAHEQVEQPGVRSGVMRDERDDHLATVALEQRASSTQALLIRQHLDGGSALRTEALGEARVDEPEERMHAARRRHGRARVADDGVLPERHRRRQPTDVADARGGHARPRRRERERVEQPAPRLVVDDVERERGLPRPGDADDRGQPGAERDVDVYEVVLRRALDAERPRLHAVNHLDFVIARDAGSALESMPSSAAWAMTHHGQHDASGRVSGSR